jgi:cytoskeletal protein RodZ
MHSHREKQKAESSSPVPTTYEDCLFSVYTLMKVDQSILFSSLLFLCFSAQVNAQSSAPTPSPPTLTTSTPGPGDQSSTHSESSTASPSSTTSATPTFTSTTPTSTISTTSLPPVPTTSDPVQLTTSNGVEVTVTITGSSQSSSSTQSAGPTAPPDESSGLSTGSIIGMSVAGGVALIGIIAFFVWKFTRKRFSDFDDSAYLSSLFHPPSFG